MPVLRSYRNKDGHYILAGINGRIVTYRVSSEGARNLNENGIYEGEKLSWPMLLELIRQGDAYTNNSSLDCEDLSGWTQLGLLDNIEEHEPAQSETVPACSCGSLEELHVVEVITDKSAKILCDKCRQQQGTEINASVPIYLINKPASLNMLLSRADLTPDKSVENYRSLLTANLASKWDSRIRKKGKPVQTRLFGETDNMQEKLL